MYIPSYVLIILLLIAFSVLLAKYKLKPYLLFLKALKQFITNHTYILLFLFPLIVLVKKLFVIESEYEDIPFLKFIFDNEFLKNLSIAVVVSGSAIGAGKYLGNLHFFKNQIDKVLSSDKFKNILSEKISEANFSPEYLANLNNIDKKWKSMTLCKYQRKFPELMKDIEPLLENELFLDNNLACYYHDFRTFIKIKHLENRIVQIIEKSYFDVKPTSSEKVFLNFGIGSIPDDNAKTFAKLDLEKSKIDGIPLKKLTKDENFCTQGNEKNHNFYIDDKYSFPLEGKDSYKIERVIEMRQDLGIDRLAAFSSSKILDSMKIGIETCQKTDFFFTGAGKNHFRIDDLINEKNHYIKDSPCLPGDIYNIFIFKKDEVV